MSYEYTTSPIHSNGLLVLGALFIIITAGLLITYIVKVMINGGRSRDMKPALFGAFISLLVGFGLIIIHLTADEPETRNEKIIAKLLPYSNDILVTTTEGKRRVQRVRTLVYYQTPDGEVSFQRASGVIYPETAVLYRNQVK